ncbi:hypothetical protein RHVP.35 [Cricetid gammaherpesvirus 2]|uniref:Tegument protein UL14 n=1 Tax=Cricetid gammaherpesvirus 2 TaxID=1605972 RepID=E9M5L9_9GAMA|nr:hypothetical protein RHVP.35 [Cricetid gammaherpesvirus 2]ADW24377.1 hypothetical protein RHVP.35 [Cricetid gammaherpesvirus 2]ADW24459.1 hypothetical protein RHVP-L.35 [Cricetid gammaherpesvirus 2]
MTLPCWPITLKILMEHKTVLKRLIGTAFKSGVEKKTAVSVYDRFGPQNPLFVAQYSCAKGAEAELSKSRELYDSAQLSNSLHKALSHKKQELAHLRACAKISVGELEKLTDDIFEARENIEDISSYLLNSEGESPEDLNQQHGNCTDDILQWRIDEIPSVPRVLK